MRSKLGKLDQSQVDGFSFLLNFVEEGAYTDPLELDDLAYVLATVWHESANTMQPVKEAFWTSESWRRNNLRYFPFYGRGYVQLTWEENYQKATRYFQDVLKIDVDFVKHPELVMHPRYAAIILIVGMEGGWFTGKSVGDYLDHVDEDDKEDLREFSNARHVVNGTDKQVKIGQEALVFEKALRKARYKPTQKATPAPAPTTPTTPQPERYSWAKVLKAAFHLLTKGRS